jgi:hypothetical protein
MENIISKIVELLKDTSLCQVFLGVTFTPIFLALYFCTLFSSTALTLGGLNFLIEF